MSTDTSEKSPKSPRYSVRDVFDRVVSDANTMLTDGILRWRVSSDGIEARLDEQKLKKRIPEQELRNEFERVLKREIVWALNAVSYDTAPAHAVKMFAEGDVAPEDSKELVSRIEVVKATFHSNELRHRLLIRKTSKGPTLEDVRWDISLKKHDLAEGPLADIPYATVEIVYSAEPSSPVFGPAGMNMRRIFGGASKSLYFDCHLDDLKALITDLQSLHANLVELSEAKGDKSS